MTTPNPMENSLHGSFSAPPKAVSKEQHVIAGILTTVYGLQELHPDVRDVTCLWLLHPRLQTQECMYPLAATILNDWNEREERSKRGLLAISFDQRNHGSQAIDAGSNEAWREGNEQHAQDMFSIYR